MFSRSHIQRKKDLWYVLLLAFPLCLILLWVLGTEEADYQEASRSVSKQVELSGIFFSRAISERLAGHFRDLETIAVVVLGTEVSSEWPSSENKTAIRRFLSVHPNVGPVDIWSTAGTRILWSSAKQGSRGLNPPARATSLPGHPDFLFGGYRYSKHAPGEAVNLLYRLRDKHGATLYYIGGLYGVPELVTGGYPDKHLTYTLVDTRDQRVLGTWHGGQVGTPPGEHQSPAVSVNVPGFPLTVVASAPNGLALREYLSAAPHRWLREAIGLILLTLVAWIVFHLLRQRDRHATRLERLAHFNAMLAQVNEIVSSEQDEQHLLQATCECAIRDGHLSVAYVARPDSHGNFMFIASAGATAYLNGLRLSSRPDIPEGQGHAGRAWREATSFYSEMFLNTPALEPWRERARRYGIRSSAALPVLRGGSVWAIFVVLHGEERVFDDDLKFLVEELARNITRGLERLDAGVREQKLASVQKTLLDNAFAGVLMVRDDRVTQANRKAAQMLGYTFPRRLVGQHTRSLFASDEAFERFERQYKTLERQPSVSISALTLASREGGAIVCDIVGGRARHEGQDTVVLTLLDVGERERTREQLQRLNDRLTLATEAAGAGVWEYDPGNDRLVWDTRLFAIYGVSPSDFSGTLEAWRQCVHPDDRAGVQEALQSALAGEGGFDAEFRIARPDGTQRWLGGKAIIVRDVQGGATRVIGVNWDITERHEAESRIQYQALHDPLTSLPNRWALEAELDQAIARARRAETALAIGMLDLDDFKPINDKYGHDAGDRLLVDLSRRLQSALRGADFVARLGGDEFVVVLEDLDKRQSLRQLSAVLDRLHRAVESSFEISPGTHVNVGLSLGLALFPVDGEDGDALLRLADAALYQIKSRKGNRQRWWALAGASDFHAEP